MNVLERINLKGLYDVFYDFHTSFHEKKIFLVILLDKLLKIFHLIWINLFLRRNKENFVSFIYKLDDTKLS